VVCQLDEDNDENSDSGDFEMEQVKGSRFQGLRNDSVSDDDSPKQDITDFMMEIRQRTMKGSTEVLKKPFHMPYAFSACKMVKQAVQNGDQSCPQAIKAKVGSFDLRTPMQRAQMKAMEEEKNTKIPEYVVRNWKD
jgi:hypothetical protein